LNTYGSNQACFAAVGGGHVNVGTRNISSVVHDDAASTITVTLTGALAGGETMPVVAYMVVNNDIADEVTADLNSLLRAAMVRAAATSTNTYRNVPAGMTQRYHGILDVTLALGETNVANTLAVLKAAYPTIDFDNEIVDFSSDNPLVIVRQAGGGFDPTGIQITNLDPTNQQVARIFITEMHSIVR
jgi:hypothetical protein